MVWSNACAVATEMIEHKSIWNAADKKFVSEAMSGVESAS